MVEEKKYEFSSKVDSEEVNSEQVVAQGVSVSSEWYGDLPSFITLNEKEQFVVKTRDGFFVLDDVQGDKPDRALKRVRQANADDLAEYALISSSLVTPKMGELQIKDELRFSTKMRLRKAIMLLYNLSDFQ